MTDTYTLRRFARSTADKVLGAEARKAADHIDAQTAEIAGLKSQVEMLEACAAGDAALTGGPAA